MSVPLKHHHLPVFYLKRWVGDDGQLTQFSRPHKEVVKRRRYPAQTGYAARLYETPGLPPEEAQRVEQKFMQHVDSLGAEALFALESDDPRLRTDRRLRSAWSRFIMSLLMRTPEDIAALKGGVAEEWMRSIPELEAKYAAKKGPDDPATFAAYFATRGPDELDQWAMSLAPVLMDHTGIGGLLNNMRWFIRRITSDIGALLTSDRPVVMSATLTERNAYLFLPIGPKAFFVAVNDDETERLVLERDPAAQVTAINELVTRHAMKFVYAQSDEPLGFVRAYMGTRRRKTLIEQLVERQRQNRSE
jgi:hypothetical protein